MDRAADGDPLVTLLRGAISIPARGQDHEAAGILKNHGGLWGVQREHLKRSAMTENHTSRDPEAFRDTGGPPTSRRRILETAVLGVAGALPFRVQEAQAQMTSSNQDRFERGLDVLRRIGGRDFDAPINSLAETSPDLAR